MSDDTANPLNVPYGYCHCGCGERTKVSPYSQRSKGLVRGEPYRYIYGHNRRNGDATPVIFDDVVHVPLCGVRGAGMFALVDVDESSRVLKHRWTLWVSKSGTKYARTTIDGKSVKLHRFIMNAPDGYDVDHWDRDGLNCQQENLRVCLPTQNNWNRVTTGGTSRFRGVAKVKNRWRAKINFDNCATALGTFDLEEDAARAFDTAARRLFGEFARLNFPRDGEQSALTAALTPADATEVK